jgi:hypothetical protein
MTVPWISGKSRSGPAEYRFDHHIAAQQDTDLQTDHRHSGNHGISQRMLNDHPGLGHAFAACQHHIIGAQGFEHARAQHSCDYSGDRCTECDGRQHQMQQAALECFHVPGQQAVQDKESRSFFQAGAECDTSLYRQPMQTDGK